MFVLGMGTVQDISQRFHVGLQSQSIFKVLDIETSFKNVLLYLNLKKISLQMLLIDFSRRGTRICCVNLNDPYIQVVANRVYNWLLYLL